MMLEDLNGSKVLIDEIDMELDKRLSQRDRLMLRSMRYLLLEVPVTRGYIKKFDGEIRNLENNNILIQAKSHPKTAAIVTLSFLALNSLVNWQGIRRPILQAAIHLFTGVMIPLDALP